MKPMKNKNNQNKEIYSHAPYNFIPLNNKVVQAEEIPEFDKYHPERYTGYIDIEIETLTPLYIRDTLTEQEYKEKLKMQKNEQQYINPDFFSPGGILRIPGSSLRGMIRTMVEIISFGKFTFFDDRRLYFRSFADACKNLRDEYRKKIKKPEAGILTKEGLNYYIVPTSFKKIEKDDVKILLENTKPFNFYPMTYNGKDGYLVVSGPMGNKKHDYFIEKPKDYSNKIHLSEDDINDYKNDKTRKAYVDLIKTLEKHKEVPCFYSEYYDSNNRKRIAFGHTLMFRIPYEKTIGDHIPSELKNENFIDIAEAIFGKETNHATRVFFEDAYLSGAENPLLPPSTPNILSSPKPTAFQHYLIQKNENLREFPENLAHYNSPNQIRGYKLYWHKDGKEWQETDEENIKKHKTQYTRITPVKEGVKFFGRIRFENLSQVELGALLFAIELPEGCAHKLGMGKPLGLGSIRIKPRLYISDRTKRYTELFYEWNEPMKSVDTNEFKKAFENYILEKLGEKQLNSLWNHQRMKKLMIMLDFSKKPDKNYIEYLPLQEFRKRKILPEPEQVIGMQT